MPLADTFRTKLQAAIDLSGMTQRDVARRAHVHYVTVSKILSGDMEPSLTMCEKLSEAVKVPAEKLLTKSA